jgi:hypothetical protein
VRLTPSPGRLVTFVVELSALTARCFGDRPVGGALGGHTHGVDQPVGPGPTGPIHDASTGTSG